jgi:hypothetical protein
MSSDEKARHKLFRLFSEQLKIVVIEAQITRHPLDHVRGFDHLAEVRKKLPPSTGSLPSISVACPTCVRR